MNASGFKEIRVIDDQGEQLGVMSPQQALAIAREKELDLVEVSPTAQPPVCRITDYGRYQYEEQNGTDKQGSIRKRSGSRKSSSDQKLTNTITNSKRSTSSAFSLTGTRLRPRSSFADARWRTLNMDGISWRGSSKT